MSEQELTLEVWRLHPRGPRIVPADKHLLGEAPRGAVKWCGPFTYANKAGWWVYPPLDVDIVYRSPSGAVRHHPKFDDDPDFQARNMMPGYFEHRALYEWEHSESAVIREMLRDDHQYRHDRRELLGFGNAEMNVANIWTGCIFRTPPGWCLHIRSPINIGLDQPFRIQEGILETDWMRYDIWMNLKFFRYDAWAHIRRDQEQPIAQLVPVRRESYDEPWGLRDNALNCEGPDRDEAVKVFDAWNGYNHQKWKSGRKDAATHHKERRKARV